MVTMGRILKFGVMGNIGRILRFGAMDIIGRILRFGVIDRILRFDAMGRIRFMVAAMSRNSVIVKFILSEHLI